LWKAPCPLRLGRWHICKAAALSASAPFIISWGAAGPMAFEKRRALSPVAPVYLNVTPQWLIEARRRPAEELLQLKWHGLFGVRAFGFAKEEFVWCLKDDVCLGALIEAYAPQSKTAA